MKLLLDACVSRQMAEALRAAGYDADWVGDWPESPSDTDVLAAAASAGRVVITLDKDFGELAVAFDQPHAGIVRLVEVSLKAQAALLQTALLRYGAELTRGAIVTASPGRIRIRMPQ